MIWTETGLRGEGFSGFVPLVDVKPETTPSSSGIYAVLRASESQPEFLDKNEAWPFRGDPTVDRSVLVRSWVTGTPVVYLGKANTLRSKIGAYRRHGTGGHSKHWAGRYVWQLADHRELLVCWRPCTEGEDPETVETALLADFRDQFGSPPFANLTN